MAKQTLAVYDSCQSYLERFLGYVAEKKDLAFEIEGFTDLTILMDHLKNTKIKVVLFSHSDMDKRQESEAEKALISAMKNGGIIVLLLGEQHESEQAWLQDIPVIEKYQSIEKILDEIWQYLEKDGSIRVPEKRNLLHLIGIYSPADKISHPKEAAFLAERIRNGDRAKKILYINLEQFSGMKEQLDYAADPCISEMIYCFRTSQAKLAENLQRIKGSYMGMDILTAPEDIGDLEEVGKKDWPEFLTALSLAGDYQYIILDLPVFTVKLMDVILEYGNLYIPALPYPREQCDRKMRLRMKEFREYLRSFGTGEKAEKILEVQLGTD